MNLTQGECDGDMDPGDMTNQLDYMIYWVWQVVVSGINIGVV